METKERAGEGWQVELQNERPGLVTFPQPFKQKSNEFILILCGENLKNCLSERLLVNYLNVFGDRCHLTDPMNLFDRD